MQELKERIVKDGVPIGTEILKVDSFLNHQIDAQLLDRIGLAFKNRFHEKTVTKLLTVEASGIAVACMAAKYFGNPPVVFAKKATPNTMTEGFYSTEVHSFTKETTSIIRVAKKFLKKEDKVLIIDDFLARGEAACGLAALVQMAGAEVVGIGAVIEKEFQGGSERLRKLGYDVQSLAVIASIHDGGVDFK